MGGAVCAGGGVGFLIGSVTLLQYFPYEQNQNSIPEAIEEKWQQIGAKYYSPDYLVHKKC